ncbi:Putative inactive purple acid phosphatase 27 [Glycine soja]|nr:Putative inactive purple acid phosphatase 27 [Glycine soja]
MPSYSFSSSNWVLKHVSILLVLFLSLSCSTSETLTPSLLDFVVTNTTVLHSNFTAVSDFRMINRRILKGCSASNPFVKVNVTSNSSFSDDEFVTVTVTGVSSPSAGDWVAMISPSTSDVKNCILNEVYYLQTGDTAKLPLLCHYPVKAQYMKNDPNYLSCKKKECKTFQNGKCDVSTCSGSLQFHVINIRSDIEFVFFSGGFVKPCLVGRSTPVSFANPKRPLYGHISSIDSTGTSMRLTWVSGDKEPQQIQYGNGKTVTSAVTTFSQDDMCSSTLPSPAKDFGWHDPGYIHSALMTGLKPSSTFSYRYGRDYIDSGSVYVTPDSGGECGVPYETYFPMPTSAKDKPWYSIEQGSVHFTVISTEHAWSENSEQYVWMQKDMTSVNRQKTPWLIFMGHRPMYTTNHGFVPSENKFMKAVEPLLLENKVDLVLFGHVHNYERTCSVFQNECKSMPTKDKNGMDTYDGRNYSAPVHAVIGMAGFTLDKFSNNFVISDTREVKDSFHITK